MSKSILVTGGAKSGKSKWAEDKVLSLAQSAIYIATAQVLDDEMARKVAVHQARRDTRWKTVQAPLELAQALQETDSGAPRLVDCLTLWVSNLMLADENWRVKFHEIADLIPVLKGPVVFVTNEVGMGIVPENALARRFRDAAGELNQLIAARCDEVYMTVSGLPLKVK